MKQKEILLVEDSKSVAKLIEKKIRRELGYNVIVADSMKRAKEIINEKHNFFISLLDLNLPDAPDGEIVDVILEKNIPAIVLTGNMSSSIRKKMSEKKIVDFLLKGKMEDIDYLGNKLKRLKHNQDITVLVVDDSNYSRKLMSTYLKTQFFNVVDAKNGIEALAKLKRDNQIKIVLTDFFMPQMDGLELTKAIREKYSREDIAIVGISVSEESDTVANFLKYGANDYLKKPFSHDEFECRINNIAQTMGYISTIRDMATRDYLTNIYNRRFFFEKAEKYYKESLKKGTQFAIVMFDIDDFKKVNDTYGHAVGDLVIKDLSNSIVAETKGADIASRFGGEEFCLIIKDVSIENGIRVVDKIRNSCGEVTFQDGEKTLKYTFSTGITVDKKSSLNEMINLSDELLYRAKENGKNRTES